MGSKLTGAVRYGLRSVGTLGIGPLAHITSAVAARLARVLGGRDTALGNFFSGFSKGIIELFGCASSAGGGNRMREKDGKGEEKEASNQNNRKDPGNPSSNDNPGSVEQEKKPGLTSSGPIAPHGPSTKPDELAEQNMAYVQKELIRNLPASLKTLFKKDTSGRLYAIDTPTIDYKRVDAIYAPKNPKTSQEAVNKLKEQLTIFVDHIKNEDGIIIPVDPASGIPHFLSITTTNADIVNLKKQIIEKIQQREKQGKVALYPVFIEGERRDEKGSGESTGNGREKQEEQRLGERKPSIDYTKITATDVSKYKNDALFLFEANERNYAKDAPGFTMFGWTGQAGTYGIEALRLGCGIGIRTSFDQKKPKTLGDFKDILDQELQRIDAFLQTNKKKRIFIPTDASGEVAIGTEAKDLTSEHRNAIKTYFSPKNGKILEIARKHGVQVNPPVSQHEVIALAA